MIHRVPRRSPRCLHSRSLHPVYRPRGFLKKWYFSLSILRCVSRSNRSRRTHTTPTCTRRARHSTSTHIFPQTCTGKNSLAYARPGKNAHKIHTIPCPKLFMSRVHSRTITPNNNQNSYDPKLFILNYNYNYPNNNNQTSYVIACRVGYKTAMRSTFASRRFRTRGFVDW